METQSEVLVLGIGNLLWANRVRRARGRGVARRLRVPAAVTLQDGGTLGLMLYEPVASARRVLVFDAIDFGLPPGTLRVLRDDEVPPGAAPSSRPTRPASTTSWRWRR